jgi:hypothetical protein
MLVGVEPLGLDRETSDAIVKALAQASVAKSSNSNTQLTIPLGPAEKPLLKLINSRFDAERKRRQSAKISLQKIALAFHRFHDKYGYFPAVSTRLPQVSQPVSWRVAILPFIGQQELYGQYNLHEPWDSESNQKLIEKMPAIYRHPNAWQRSTNANHAVFVGDTATGTGAEQVELASITDGTSRTIMVVEAATSIPWTKPEDLEFDAAKPLPPVGDLTRDGWHAALADGSVTFIPLTTSIDVVKALITPAGGEPVKEEGDTFVLAREPQATDEEPSQNQKGKK